MKFISELLSKPAAFFTPEWEDTEVEKFPAGVEFKNTVLWPDGVVDAVYADAKKYLEELSASLQALQQRALTMAGWLIVILTGLCGGLASCLLRTGGCAELAAVLLYAIVMSFIVLWLVIKCGLYKSPRFGAGQAPIYSLSEDIQRGLKSVLEEDRTATYKLWQIRDMQYLINLNLNLLHRQVGYYRYALRLAGAALAGAVALTCVLSFFI